MSFWKSHIAFSCYLCFCLVICACVMGWVSLSLPLGEKANSHNESTIQKQTSYLDVMKNYCKGQLLPTKIIKKRN
jgi:hypothetical protein